MALPEPGPPSGPWSGRVFSAGDTPASTANIANIITVVRILLAPVFVVLLLDDDHSFGPLRWVAAVLFVVAIATDSLDGFLARRQNLVTDFGKIVDPIADKVLIGSALIVLSVLGELWWWVTIVILLREFGITIFRFIVIKRSVIPAVASGKLKTVFQAVAISLFLFPLAKLFGAWVLLADWAVMGIAFLLTVVSGVDFFVKYLRANR